MLSYFARASLMRPARSSSVFGINVRLAHGLSKSEIRRPGGFRSFALEDPRPSQEGISGQMGPNEKTDLHWVNRRREISEGSGLIGRWLQAPEVVKGWPMSQLGQSRHFGRRPTTSGLLPEQRRSACLNGALSRHSGARSNDRKGRAQHGIASGRRSQRSLWFVKFIPAVPAGRKKERNTARHVRVDSCIQRLEVHLEQRPEQHGHGDDIQEEPRCCCRRSAVKAGSDQARRIASGV